MINLSKKNPAFTAFLLILIFTLLNSFFNSLSSAFGLNFPYTTFLFSPGDLFADYFKVIFSYPHVGFYDLETIPKFSNLLKSYFETNPYQGVTGLLLGDLSHFHLTPLTTLVSLLSFKLMQYISPLWLFCMSMAVIFIIYYYIINKVVVVKNDKLLWYLSLLISYPTLFFVTRGNIFAGITSMSILGFLVFFFKGKKYFAYFLLAVAVNIRPNAIIYVCAVLINNQKIRYKELVYFVAFSAAIFMFTLYFSNSIYHDYTLSNFLSGLKIYHSLYVYGNGGMAYGSSLFSPLKVLFGANSFSELSSLFIAGIFLLVSIILKLRNNISDSIYVFLISSCYVLGSSVFADYHLGVFISPLLLYYLEKTRKSVSGISNIGNIDSFEFIMIYASSILMLSPKNYIFYHGYSLQVILNPLILLFSTSLIIFYYASKRNKIKSIITNGLLT